METASLELGHESRREESDTNRRILMGTVEIWQDSSTSEDAVSRLAQRHITRPQLTIRTNDMNVNRYCQALKKFAEDPMAFASILECMLLLFAVCIRLPGHGHC